LVKTTVLPDRLASPIDQRATAVPRIDVRICLDEAAGRLQFDLALEGAHDANGGRLIEAKGAADGRQQRACHDEQLVTIHS